MTMRRPYQRRAGAVVTEAGRVPDCARAAGRGVAADSSGALLLDTARRTFTSLLDPARTRRRLTAVRVRTVPGGVRVPGDGARR